MNVDRDFPNKMADILRESSAAFTASETKESRKVFRGGRSVQVEHVMHSYAHSLSLADWPERRLQDRITTCSLQNARGNT